MIVTRTIALILAAALTAIIGCQPPSSTPADQNQPQANKTERRLDFDRRFSQWKAFVSELRDLDLEYRTGSQGHKQTIKPRYDQLVTRGEEMQVDLIDSAVLAYVESPTTNGDLQGFLSSVLNSEMHANRYEDALRLAQLLIDNGFQNRINPHRQDEVPPADKILKARVLRKRNHPYQPKGRPRR